jgi:hypothetical protein
MDEDKLLKKKEIHRKGMIAYAERQKDVRHKCPICGKLYATLNKSHHYNSKFHINSENLLKLHGIIKDENN